MNAYRPVSASLAQCRNCAGKDLAWNTHHLAMAVPEGYPLSGEMAVTLCRDCGFVGNYSPAGADAYVDYYTHYNKHHTRKAALHDLDEAYFNGVLDLVEREAAPDWSQADMLDWGSGALLFSELAAQRGARSAHNYDMAGAYPDLDYKLIVSTHCMEHVLDFNGEFSRIHKALGEDGLFLVAVPDLRGYCDVYWGPYAAFDLEHINHFDAASLGNALQRAGFEIVAVRESERMVTPTLAYPEVLVLARKASQAQPSTLPAAAADSAQAQLTRYFARAEADLTLMVDTVMAKIADYETRGVAASAGIYGVASYAFRLIHVLAAERGFHFSWLADSDSRLAGKQLDNLAIKHFEGFSDWVSECEEQNVRCLVFVAAVNAERIEAFLKDKFGSSIEVCVLPPDCQNRD